MCLDVYDKKCVKNDFGCFIGTNFGRVIYMSTKPIIGGF